MIELIVFFIHFVLSCRRSVHPHVRLSSRYPSVRRFFSPDGLGMSPALCHMISLQAAGVKLIWSGLKAYKRLMFHINCSHLNSRLPSLKCPACPRFAPEFLDFNQQKTQNEVLCLYIGVNKTYRYYSVQNGIIKFGFKQLNTLFCLINTRTQSIKYKHSAPNLLPRRWIPDLKWVTFCIWMHLSSICCSYSYSCS